MRKILVALSMTLLLWVSSSAEASLIRYNIVGGVDTERNEFSGFVDIESNPIYEVKPNAAGGMLRYDISTFLFVSSGGINYGDSGSLNFFIRASDGFVGAGSSNALFSNDYSINFVGKNNLSSWINGGTGIWFTGIEPTLDAYSYLPEQIVICPTFMAGGATYFDNWGPAGDGWNWIVLDRAEAPVPEPTTMLLFGTGLAGLAAVGRRRRS
jgi:hypothetical protein